MKVKVKTEIFNLGSDPLHLKPSFCMFVHEEHTQGDGWLEIYFAHNYDSGIFDYWRYDASEEGDLGDELVIDLSDYGFTDPTDLYFHFECVITKGAHVEAEVDYLKFVEE